MGADTDENVPWIGGSPTWKELQHGRNSFILNPQADAVKGEA